MELNKMLQNSMQRHKLPKEHRSVCTRRWGYRKEKKKRDSSLGNNRPWKLLWERKSEMSRNHQKSREIFKGWFIYLTLHIYKSHDKYFCKWSSTGHSWISTELFSTESLGVRAPDYLGRSSRSSWCIKEQEQIVFKDPICSTVRRNQEFNRVTNISKSVFNRKPFESACYTAVKMWLL